MKSIYKNQEVNAGHRVWCEHCKRTHIWCGYLSGDNVNGGMDLKGWALKWNVSKSRNGKMSRVCYEAVCPRCQKKLKEAYVYEGIQLSAEEFQSFIGGIEDDREIL